MPIQTQAFSYWPAGDANKRIVTDGAAFESMLRHLQAGPTLTVDYETSGTAWHAHARSIGIALATWDRGTGQIQNYYVPYRHRTGEHQLEFDTVAPAIKALLEDESKLKICQNIKFEDHFSRKEGWELRGPRFDTMIAGHLYDENMPLKLETRAQKILGRDDARHYELEMQKEELRLARAHKVGIRAYKYKHGYEHTPINLCGTYAGFDTDHTTNLFFFYENWGIRSRYPRIWPTEMDLTAALCDMEENGLPVDVEYLENLRDSLGGVLAGLEDQIKSALGPDVFRLGSDDELRFFLTKKLRLPLFKKTKGNKFSVDREVLEHFKGSHPVVKMLLDWRDAQKLASTYTISILEKLDEHGVAHPDFQQVGANTARLACREPNFQNQPTDDDERAVAFSGKKVEDGGIDPWSIRRAFVVRKDGGRVIPRLYFDYCLHPDTEIETIDGLRRIGDVKVGDKVYTLDGRRVSWGTVSKSCTIQLLPSYRITFDNGESVIASADHRWPVRVRGQRKHKKGPAPLVLTEKRTDTLEVGERMVPMRRVVAAGGYIHLYSYSAFEYTKEHLLVAEAAFGSRRGRDVHHIDGDKDNNTSVNLSYVNPGRHKSEHAKDNYRKQDHTKRIERLREGLKRRRSYNGEGNPNFGKRSGEVRSCPCCGAEFYVYPSQSKTYCSRACFSQARKNGNNHRVVSIEYVGVQPMHAITVPSTGNYILGAGVVTCNSQIELRTIAYYSADPTMLQVYLTGGDIHSAIGREVNRPRRIAKIISFGLSYGLTEMGLARQAKLDPKQAAATMQRFFQRFPGILQLRNRLWASMRADPQCSFTNLFGRQRRVPLLNSTEDWERGRAERQAIGSLIQGTAAELTKESIVRIAKFLREERLPAKLVNTVHDEIQLDCPAEALVDVVRGVKARMEDYPEFSPIPVLVDGDYTTQSWADKQPLPKAT